MFSLFAHVAKRLDKKEKTNFKFYDVKAVIHILSNISRSKGNQIMKFSHLKEYNMRNIFLEKSYSNCGGETSPRNFSEKLKLSISLDQ